MKFNADVYVGEKWFYSLTNPIMTRGPNGWMVLGSTGMYFSDNARAARIARALKGAGHRVYWTKSFASSVATSATREQVHEIIQATEGVMDDWQNAPGFDDDVGPRKEDTDG